MPAMSKTIQAETVRVRRPRELAVRLRGRVHTTA